MTDVTHMSTPDLIAASTPGTAAASTPGTAAASPPDAAAVRAADVAPERAPDAVHGRRARLSATVERRLAVPVVVAAVVSVPAVFLTTLRPPYASVGTALNWASLAVLGTESMVLFLLAGDRLRWLRRHRWTIAVTVAAVPAVVFAVAPVQVLRLVRLWTALGVLRANRILTAGRVLRRRMGLRGLWGHTTLGGMAALAAGFAALVLADPASPSRQALERIAARLGLAAILLAGALALAAAAVARYHRRHRR